MGVAPSSQPTQPSASSFLSVSREEVRQRSGSDSEEDRFDKDSGTDSDGSGGTTWSRRRILTAEQKERIRLAQQHFRWDDHVSWFQRSC